ncbi:SDR family oxidoreductase [Chryseosolibacter indicus]|uniref:SDR family oxidoreductase n=1 Tax=Chryseosolibacter indicus TaxID=2782351 RepID=A0ABS5VNH7_9BACT|nr:SDR family oxidoreductase [Chryseosolibacter indicus]MBT1702993.1 SDR family oxidoreductase [Chryseosolibacter indicus]
MNLDLNGRHAVVCGSTQGIGKASAIELASLGATITLIARDEAKLKNTILGLPANKGQKHDYLVADFNYPQQLQEKVSAYAASNTVHILVNNTGGPPGGPALNASLDEFTKAFAAHLLCNHILVQAFTAGMKKEMFGRIINVISTSVKIPIKGLGVSNTIRGAVANWSKTLSSELGAYNITVNNVLPGAAMTARLESIIRDRAQKSGKTIEEVQQEMVAEIPSGRIATAQEIAAAVAFLATPAAAYINGINLPVDGGRTGSL